MKLIPVMKRLLKHMTDEEANEFCDLTVQMEKRTDANFTFEVQPDGLAFHFQKGRPIKWKAPAACLPTLERIRAACRSRHRRAIKEMLEEERQRCAAAE